MQVSRRMIKQRVKSHMANDFYALGFLKGRLQELLSIIQGNPPNHHMTFPPALTPEDENKIDVILEEGYTFFDQEIELCKLFIIFYVFSFCLCFCSCFCFVYLVLHFNSYHSLSNAVIWEGFISGRNYERGQASCMEEGYWEMVFF